MMQGSKKEEGKLFVATIISLSILSAYLGAYLHFRAMDIIIFEYNGPCCEEKRHNEK